MGGAALIPQTVKTTCPYCGVGCGVSATPNGTGGAKIAGDPGHPSNFGKLCSKGSALGETLGLETRLLHPQINGARVSWTTALDHIAARLGAIRQEHGPNSIAFYLSGQLLTEDYYVANKLAKGFIGTPHVDTNSRLCMASSVAGHRRAFGADVVPQCYEDLDDADLVVLAGSNTAWCHPILYQRIQRTRGERGARVVNIDPRRTATSEGADLQLSLKPGTDSALWNGLLVWLADHDALDAQFIANHTTGFDTALAEARQESFNLAAVAKTTGLERADIETFYTWWTASNRVVSCYSQGINQSVVGTDKVNAIINCHLATGRIGKVGSGPLSLTGQPNAMGGREVGGLANMLAAHMMFSDVERDRVARFWQAPNIVTGEGKKAVAMFDAIASGEIKALWVMGTNPAVSLPKADAVRVALGQLELFVVSENVNANDTLDCAPVRLPAHAWSEKDGTVTNSERRISRQRAFATPAGEAKADWWALSQVADRLGYGAAFAYSTPAEIFREHAALSAFENNGTRPFDLSALADISNAEYDAFQPVQWPVRHVGAGTERMFADGNFATPDGKARILAVKTDATTQPVNPLWPFVLNTGRVRDQWHTMTRTGLSPRLSTHIAEPFAELHPDDAKASNLAQGEIVQVETSHGRAYLRTLVSSNVQQCSLFVPIHWTKQNSSRGRTGPLVHDLVDPVSGQPDAKATPARVSKPAVAAYGFLIARNPNPAVSAFYWSRAVVAQGSITHVALDAGEYATLHDWFAATLPDGDLITYADPASGVYRTVVVVDGRLEAVLFLGPTPTLPATTWLATQLGQTITSATERRSILAGRPLEGAADDGPVVCVCFQVGAKRITGAIQSGCTSVEAIGARLQAGTNCGSCIPEMKRMLATNIRQVAAE
jgi:assimilatory nitrate reductase catalytic subunit